MFDNPVDCLGCILMRRSDNYLLRCETSLTGRFGNESGTLSTCNQIIRRVCRFAPHHAVRFFLEGTQVEHVTQYRDAAIGGEGFECCQAGDDRRWRGIMCVIEQHSVTYPRQGIQASGEGT